MGLHSSCNISPMAVEHVKNVLQNITTEWTPHSVQSSLNGKLCYNVVEKNHWVTLLQVNKPGTVRFCESCVGQQEELSMQGMSYPEHIGKFSGFKISYPAFFLPRKDAEYIMMCGAEVISQSFRLTVRARFVRGPIAYAWHFYGCGNKRHSCAESGNVIEVGIFSPSKVALLSSLWTKFAEIWYTFNLT